MSKDIKEDNKKEEKKNTDRIHITKTIIEGVGTVGKIVTDSIFNHEKNEIEKLKIEKDAEIKKLEKENEQMKLELKRKEEEEKKEKERIIEGNKEWKNERNNIINSIIINIIYVDLIEKTYKEYLINFKNELEKKIILLFKNNNNEKYKLLIKNINDLIFNKIKDKIPKIKTLNFIILGFTGAGKSCLTNAILKKILTKESSGINSGTQEFYRYDNPDEVPGIAIYDTIGVEPTNAKRNLIEIKALVKKTFEDNLQDSDKSLHGIIYCIKNGSDANRILDGEINFIKELNDIYGNSDILTIAFTQSLDQNNEKIKERMNELREKMNNNEIEIIPVHAKEEKIKIYNQEIIVPQFGLIELKNTMMKNSKKIIMAHLKYSTKKIMIEYYKNNIKEIYNEMDNKYKIYEFNNTFIKESEIILKNLFEENNLIDINFDFTDIEKYILDNIEKMNEKIKNILIEKYEDKSINKIYENFNNFNLKYDKKLNDNNMKEYFISKFNEFFENEITKKISKIITGKSLKIFLDKSIDIICELISNNISNEELEDLVKYNINNLLAKINKNNAGTN